MMKLGKYNIQSPGAKRRRRKPRIGPIKNSIIIIVICFVFILSKYSIFIKDYLLAPNLPCSYTSYEYCNIENKS